MQLSSCQRLPRRRDVCGLRVYLCFFVCVCICVSVCVCDCVCVAVDEF